MRKYLIKYEIKRGEFLIDNNTPIDENTGYCDAIILHSIIFDEHGRSEFIIGAGGGDENTMGDIEEFKSLYNMAHNLQHSDQLSDNQKEACSSFVDKVKGIYGV